MDAYEIACERREARQDFKKFAALIATPGDLVAGVSLPANGLFSVSTTSVLAATTVLVNAGTRALGAPAQAAGVTYSVGKLSRAVRVVKDGLAPGTVKLYVRDGFGKPHLIAQG